MCCTSCVAPNVFPTDSAAHYLTELKEAKAATLKGGPKREGGGAPTGTDKAAVLEAKKAAFKAANPGHCFFQATQREGCRYGNKCHDYDTHPGHPSEPLAK